ncbi:MAG: hypothetical protein M3N50_11415 [Pseudomonadota bacterium]|nr:hypothetical protein [Pseudomonadota bacterium]
MPIQSTRQNACRTSCELFAFILVAVLWNPSDACASGEDPSASMFSFSGFGTLGVVHSSEHKADFTSTIFKPDGAGYSHDWSAAVDSLIAAQVSAQFTPQLTAVLQVVAEQNYDNSYRPHVEWANIKYQFTPDFNIRVGRTVLPGFLHSDTRAVGYTYAWVRPPVEVYRLLPITTGDGVDVSYHVHIGDFTNTLQANFGKNHARLPQDEGGGSSDATHLWGISNTSEYGALSVRITYQKSKLAIPAFDALFDAFRQFGEQGAAIADRYNSQPFVFTVIGAGASYDPGDWFVMGEWGRVVSDSVLGTRGAWYVSGGYRLGKITPYVTYAKATADNLSDPGLTVAALPAELAGRAASLNAALDSILSSTIPAENTISVGGRWDFMKKADLKLQFDRTRIGAGSAGVLSNIQPGFQLGGRVNVFSATVDFVF